MESMRKSDRILGNTIRAWRHPHLLATLVLLLFLIIITSVNSSSTTTINQQVTNELKQQEKVREPISLEEAFLGELNAKYFTFNWLPPLDSAPSDSDDQFVFEDAKNLMLFTLPSTERKNTGTNLNLAQISKQQQQSSVNIFVPNITVLVSNSSSLNNIEYNGFKLSPSRRYLLVWNSKRKMFRHSFTAKYFIYDIKLDLIFSISTKNSNQTQESIFPPDFFNKDDNHLFFQKAEWYLTTPLSQTDQLVESLILVQNNDIYMLNDVSNLTSSKSSNFTESYLDSSVPIRLTTTGRPQTKFNGVPDWLYEEEILGDTPAFYVSPSGKHLAYLSFDDSFLDVIPFTFYGESDEPRLEFIRYPKAGQLNPRVEVRLIHNLTSAKRKDIKLNIPVDLHEQGHYIYRINWLTSDKLAIVWANRNQNLSHILLCSHDIKSVESLTWKCEKNFQTQAVNGWLDISDDLYPLNDDYYLAILPKYEGADVGYFKNIAKVSLRQFNDSVFITSGRREVLSIDGIDYKRSLVYYTSTVEEKPGQRQLFVAEFDKIGSKQRQRSDMSPDLTEPSSSVCVTCDHHPDGCLYNRAKLSPSTSHYVFHCSGPDVPKVELRSTRRRRHRFSLKESSNSSELTNRQRRSQTKPSVVKVGNSQLEDVENNPEAAAGQESLLWVIEDNKELRSKLENEKLLPVTLRLRVPIANTDYLANVILLLPPIPTFPTLQNLRSYLTTETIKEYTEHLPKNISKYPMIVDVYAGPGSQKVDFGYHIGFGHYMASSKQVVYAMIDGRGSGYQGTNRLFELYHKLGTVEIQDQIDTVVSLTKLLPFIDPKKVAIWGWSYGGYAAAMSLAQGQMRGKNDLLANIENPPSPIRSNASKSVFKCAASVAPVTNWIYYDTAYTERYMSSPWLNEHYDNKFPGDHHLEDSPEVSQLVAGSYMPKRPYQAESLSANKWIKLNGTDNKFNSRSFNTKLRQLLNISARGESPSHNSPMSPPDLNERYRRASLLEQMTSIEPKSYLLIHGTADDNVHFQHSIMLTERFIQRNILFKTQLYPDQDHSIANKADKKHLGNTLSDFFDQCFV